MATKLAPLLCELHAHTTWSDGALSSRELIDLYGRAGFDVLAVTDHTVPGACVQASGFAEYLEAVEVEAERARRLYDLLVIPGLELTWDDPDVDASAHAVAVGLEAHVGLDEGLEAALCDARDRGAAIIAAHPHGIETDPNERRMTRWWWLDRRLRALAHRFELVNRHQVFAWVAAEGLPSVASGDAHLPAHIATWKTLLPCARSAADVLDCLRSDEPTPITRFQPEGSATLPAAGALRRAG